MPFSSSPLSISSSPTSLCPSSVVSRGLSRVSSVACYSKSHLRTFLTSNMSSPSFIRGNTISFTPRSLFVIIWPWCTHVLAQQNHPFIRVQKLQQSSMTECPFLKVLHIANLFLWSTDNSSDNQSSPRHSMRYASPWSPQSPTAGSNIIDLTVPAKEPEVIDLTYDDDDDDAIQASHGTKREASYDNPYNHFAKRVTRTRVCSTCDEERAVRWYPTTRGLRTHNHSSDNCMTCYQTHIATQLELRNDAHVPCLQCGEMLIHADIEGLVDKEQYLR